MDEEVTADVDDVDVAEIAAGAVVAVEVASTWLRASALGLHPPEEEVEEEEDVVEVKASAGTGDGAEGEISLFPRVPLTDEGFETERLEGSVKKNAVRNGFV